MKKITIFLLVSILALGLNAAAGAAVVTLPDESGTTTFTATVAEQANVSVPANIAFTVNDVSSSTDGTGDVSASTIVLNDGNALKISLKANASTFTAATGGTVTWDASDVSWTAGTWTNGAGSSGTLDSAAYNEVAHSDANASSTGSTITFTLAAKATVDRAGDHTLAATWKFESYTPI